MPSEPTDLELVREVLAGRTDRFEILIHRYQRLVATAALRMGVPRQEIEDVTNEVFYKVYRSLRRYEPAHAMSTWLYRITVNAALDRRRSLRHEASRSELPVEIRDDSPTPDQTADESSRARLLHEALGRIPEHYRTPLMLMHVEGLAVEEVSRILGLPEGTVKSRLFRARAMLKQVIMRHYPVLTPMGETGETL
ncbi:MAG: sigma-70 family RNA polymerase sigma factor [Acidobacteriota bacterium]